LLTPTTRAKRKQIANTNDEGEKKIEDLKAVRIASVVEAAFMVATMYNREHSQLLLTMSYNHEHSQMMNNHEHSQ
jgi:hypothetical protein